MSKYKVGDKFIIEIAEVYENVLSGIYGFKATTSEPIYRIKGFNTLIFDKNGLDKLEEIEDKKNDIAPENIRVGDVVIVGDGDIQFICTKDNQVEIIVNVICYLAMVLFGKIVKNLTVRKLVRM